MTTFLDKALVAVAGLGLMCFAWSGQRWWSATGNLAVAQAQDARAAGLVSEVKHLRTLKPIVNELPTSSELILGMVADSLAQAGINHSASKDVSAEQDSGPLPGGNMGGTSGSIESYRKQSIRVQLEGVSVPDIGRLLAAWSKAHPTWVATTVNLSPQPKNESSGKGLDPNPAWSATLVFTSVYLAGGTGGPRMHADPPSGITSRKAETVPQKRRNLMPETP